MDKQQLKSESAMHSTMFPDARPAGNRRTLSEFVDQYFWQSKNIQPFRRTCMDNHQAPSVFGRPERGIHSFETQNCSDLHQQTIAC